MKIRRTIKVILIVLAIVNFAGDFINAQTYKIVDTGQKLFYDNSTTISTPSSGDAFYGQDAQFDGNQPSYKDNGDGTVTDFVTMLMWTQSYDINGDGKIDYNDKLYAQEAQDSASSCKVGGYSDWRLPTIKELYSLILLTGNDLDPTSSTTNGAKPFIDTSYFKIGYGDQSAGDRIIDAQVATSTYYGSTTMNGNTTMFGVNFIDGRIKGYPADLSIGKKYYVLYVRGNPDYGKNKFVDNGNGTITDDATDLMWTKDDNKQGMNWEQALDWVKQKNSENYLGHNDWRLPNVKELQSIVDYTRCPDITNSPAIDSLFNCTQIMNEAGQADYPFYWTGTTHTNLSDSQGQEACYVCFGRGVGYMSQFGGWVDVHGAGAQRTDPKSGDPSNYPEGRGPQGDAIRIDNYVRLVRDAGTATSVGQNSGVKTLDNFVLNQNYPNPFNPSTNISYEIPKSSFVSLKVYDIIGKEVRTLVNENQSAGSYVVNFDASKLSSGIYIYQLNAGEYSKTMKMICLK